MTAVEIDCTIIWFVIASSCKNYSIPQIVISVCKEIQRQKEKIVKTAFKCFTWFRFLGVSMEQNYKSSFAPHAQCKHTPGSVIKFSNHKSILINMFALRILFFFQLEIFVRGMHFSRVFSPDVRIPLCKCGIAELHCYVTIDFSLRVSQSIS